VNAKGTSSLGTEQMDLLREEGVEVSREGRIDLGRFGWEGTDAVGKGDREGFPLFS